MPQFPQCHNALQWIKSANTQYYFWRRTVLCTLRRNLWVAQKIKFIVRPCPISISYLYSILAARPLPWTMWEAWDIVSYLVKGYAVIHSSSTVPKVLWYARCQLCIPGIIPGIGRWTVQAYYYINWKLVTIDCSYTGVISTVKETSYCSTPLAGLPVLLPPTWYSSGLYLVLYSVLSYKVCSFLLILLPSNCTCTRYWSTVLKLMKWWMRCENTENRVDPCDNRHFILVL
jgi:hypothetical protein